MVVLGIAVVIALVVAFFLLERRAGVMPTDARRGDAERLQPDPQEPEPEQDIYKVEHDIYEELYADRSGEVSPGRPRRPPTRRG